MGRHLTEVWKLGTGDTHLSDRIEIVNRTWKPVARISARNAARL
jgi:hypothetical protein